MIDIENELFNSISTKLKTEYEYITVVGEDLIAPASFPAVSFVETDNYISQQYVDSRDENQIATIVYTVNVYSNKIKGKKTECKKIINVIDEIMTKYGFYRTSKEHLTINDSTICRMITRYSGVVDNNKIIYGR